MGVSSSQPIPSSQDYRSIPFAAETAATPSLTKTATRYTPTMDDEAASQQLMSEARATTHSADYAGPAIPLNLGAAARKATKETPDSSKKRVKKLRSTQTGHRDTLHDSPLPTYSLDDLRAFVGTSPSMSRTFSSTAPSTQIEVPDSQAELQANGAPYSTSMTASTADSPNALKKPSKNGKNGKRSKKIVPSNVELTNANTIPATPYEENPEEVMSSSAQADKSQVSSKKHRKNKARTSTDSANLGLTEVSETPATTQEVALATAADDADMRNGISNVDEQPVTPRDLLRKLNAERLQNSTPDGKVLSPANAAEDTTHSSDEEVEQSDAAATAHTPSTPGTSISASSRERTSTKDRIRARYRISGIATRNPKISRADPNKNYQRAHDDDDRTAADRALETTHELGHPPDKRASGEYTADENELLRRAIRDYQERSGLDTADLVEIIQWGPRREKRDGDYQASAQFKTDCNAFWDDIKSIGLLRSLRDLRKHVRATYHMHQRGRWSEDDDQQLRELVQHHPGQWRLIATQLNRLELDAHNRWKDYLRHGENRNTKRWTIDEEENLVRVLNIVCQRIEDSRAELGKPPLEDYNPVINWNAVCTELGDTRSRLQCQSKWKIMRAREPPATIDVEIKPRRTPPPEVIPEKKKKKSAPKSKAKKDRQAAATQAVSRPPGPDDMLWGDKFDLIAELSEQAAANESASDDEIVWRDVATLMNNNWSVRTLKTAFKQLCDLVLDPEDDDDLTHRLTSLFHFIKENHRNEVEDRYHAMLNAEDNVENGPQAKSSKKRKRQSNAGSSKGSAKKRSKRTSSTAQVFKSKEIITDSEPEL